MALISVMSPKGGCGKTTISILLAGEFAHRGEEVLIIDTDDAQNAVAWSEMESVKDIEVKGVSSAQELEEVLRGEAAQDWRRQVIVDTRGASDAVTVLAGRMSNIIVIPSKLNGQDIEKAFATATKTVPLLEEMTQRKIPHLVVLNEVDLISSSSKEFDFIGDLFKEQGINIAKSRIWMRKPYRVMTTTGGTVYTLKATKSSLEGAQASSSELLDEVLMAIEAE